MNKNSKFQLKNDFRQMTETIDCEYSHVEWPNKMERNRCNAINELKKNRRGHELRCAWISVSTQLKFSANFFFLHFLCTFFIIICHLARMLDITQKKKKIIERKILELGVSISCEQDTFIFQTKIVFFYYFCFVANFCNSNVRKYLQFTILNLLGCSSSILSPHAHTLTLTEKLLVDQKIMHSNWVQAHFIYCMFSTREFPTFFFPFFFSFLFHSTLYISFLL